MSVPIINLTGELSNAGAYQICVKEIWSMNIIVFSLINVITIAIMMILHKKGKPGLADRGLNILFIINVFALTVNVVIALGFKFLPV